jgi:pyridoxamine 5'-phosphate oxidase
MSFADIRREYTRAALDEKSVARTPLAQFETWYGEALRAGIPLANAFALATADRGGRPSVRAVLLKAYDEHGFVFYTHYRSRKARELAENPRASALFWWEPLERQVRIEGRVERIAEHESDAYFASRPLGSRLGAWASPQSEVLAGRAALEERLAEVTRRHGREPPRPPDWGGLRLVASGFEFWQGRMDRLHDRIVYRRHPPGDWLIERLAP